jgi:hypothetical protein
MSVEGNGANPAMMMVVDVGLSDLTVQRQGSRTVSSSATENPTQMEPQINEITVELEE